MLRAGVSLPAVMQLLGHTSINMTLRYIKVTQNDLQRAYHLARQNMASLHVMPEFAGVTPQAELNAGIPAIARSMAAMRHLLEMYRRQLTDQKARRKLERLANRLVKISTELNRLATLKK